MASKIIVDQLQKTTGGLAALELPSADATANQTLKNDGAGALSWSKVTEDMRTLGTGEVLDANIATDTISVDKISGSAAAAAGTFLKQDGTWGTAGSFSGIEDDIALLGFKVAVNGALSKYNLVDQTEDAFQDQVGIDLSTSTNEVYDIAGKYYTGQITAPTGGAITTYTDAGTDYVVHSFLSGTTQFVTDKVGTVDYLLVAGGGGGCEGGIGGGGGAGGMLNAAGLSVAIGSHPVVIGAGGPAWVTGVAVYGEDTTFTSLTAIGGGAGIGSASTGATGGSGGGGGGYASGNGGAGTVGQGNAGGGGAGGSGSYGAGGGGGAGAVGANGVTPSGGNGGVGLSNSLRTNSGVFYAGGGGGAPWSGSYGAGGNGGGGASALTGVAGTVNTGGGGGASKTGPGGAGGSGIAVIRYVDGSMGPDYNQLTLVSHSTTAETAPTKGDIVMTYTNGVAGVPGEAVLNTDLTAEFSADNGSTWTSTTLVDQGSTGTHIIASAHDVTRTSTSGTSMVYRIKTFNQTAAKETRIQAVSLGWS